MLLNLLYAAALAMLSPMIAFRMWRHGRYRRGVSEKLWGLSQDRADELRNGCDEVIWLHAVSVGEVNLLPELVKRLQEQAPSARVVISSSTDTGYDLAIKHFGAARVFFCPLDFTWAVRGTLKRLQCKRLILAELELWPNLIATANREGCRVDVINGRLSETSGARYQQFGWLTRSIFAGLSGVACQDAETASRFVACGTPADRVRITGSLKFDNAPRDRDDVEVNERSEWSRVDPWHRVWCCGSTQAGEESMSLRIYRELSDDYPHLRLIIVPRHPERFDTVADLIQLEGFRVIRRSQVIDPPAGSWARDEVVLIDTIGELRAWWGVCQIATVGGSFGDRGGQNMLEPAGYGCAVSFGPNTKNFQQIAGELLRAGGAVRVADQRELHGFVQRCLDEAPVADALGRTAQSVVDQHRGAYHRTLDMLLDNAPAQDEFGAIQQRAA